MTARIEWRKRGESDVPLRKLAEAEGYAMVRHKGCSPFIIDAKAWAAMSLCDHLGRPLL